MPVTFTTDLPNNESLALDASQTETLGVQWDDPLNNGEYRLEIRDDDPDGNHPPYEHEITLSHDQTTQHTISNILAGEQYSVRVRTQTAYVTGDWLAAEEITKLLASDALEVTGAGMAHVDLQWTINNDFRGSHQVYRQRTDYEYSSDPASDGRLVGSVADSAASYTDGVAPDREYRYQVRTLTQWQYADSGVSDPVRTQNAGLEQSPVSPSGWHVEIEHPSGTTLTPQILGNIQRRPRLNETPRVEIPVPRDETWLSESLDDATLRVWKDGERLAIDTLEDREIQPDRVILYGTVTEGVEDRVQADVEVERADDLALQLIGQTGLVANVDEAASSLQEDELMLEASSTSELEDALVQALPETAPVEISNGAVSTLQTCWTREAEDHDRQSGDTFQTENADNYSGGAGVGFRGQASSREFDFDVTHTIPEGELEIWYRNEGTGVDAPNIRWFLDDELVSDTNTTLSLGWNEVFSSSSTGSEPEAGTPPALKPGTHTLRIEDPGNGGNDNRFVDVVALMDSRFHPEPQDNSVHEPQGYLDGPATHPETIDLEIGDAETIFAVVNGYADIVMDDTSNQQALAISNDRGRTWTSAPNTQSLSAQFGDVGDSLRLRVTLSNYGQRDTATPRTGFNGQTLSSLELRADIDDTPLVIDETFDGDLAEVLATIAQDSNSIWEVSRDGDQLSIEWTQPGQRSAGGDLDVVDYTTRRVPPRMQRAIVRGSRREIREETLEVTIGEAIDLAEPEGEDILVTGSDRIVGADGLRYERGVDYDIDRQAATITPLSSGDLEAGQEVLVDYDYRIAGTFESDDYSGTPREEHVEDITGLTTRRACAQAAKLLVDRGSVARTEADVSLPPSIPAELSLVEMLDLEDVPGDAMEVYQLVEGPEGLEARLGDEDRVRDTVSQLRRRAEALSRRV